MINYSKQLIDNADISAIIDVLKSDYLTTGPKVAEFEKELSKFTGYKYAVCVNSGTAALHCALHSCNIQPGDEIIIPTITFVATANVVKYFDAVPILCDIDKDTLLIDIECIKGLITDKTKAIICVDFAGQLCNYEEIRKICDRYKLKFIADSCHAFNSISYIFKNQIPDYVCYSFHPVKHLTTGEGGAILTNDSMASDFMKYFRNHGRTEDGKVVSIGYNYRMSDISAALGISQLKKQVKKLTRIFQIVKKYDSELTVGKLKKVNYHSYHLYVIFVNNRNKFIEYMKENGVNCVIHYQPIYELYQYENLKTVNGYCHNTEEIKDKIVSIPLHCSLTDKDVNKIIDLVNYWNLPFKIIDLFK